MMAAIPKKKTGNRAATIEPVRASHHTFLSSEQIPPVKSITAKKAERAHIINHSVSPPDLKPLTAITDSAIPMIIIRTPATVGFHVL
jgi:hypothetical protein